MPSPALRVLFLVEGFTDIRFVAGLSGICDLTMVVPRDPYESSGLKDRIEAAGAALSVESIRGGRLGFQARAMAYLWRRAQDFNAILAQEVLRGALGANIVGVVRGIPVITYTCIAPAEYFHCRRERGEIGWLKWCCGDAIIRSLMALNGRLATRCLAMGPYLRELAGRYCPRTETTHYFGVDTEYFRPGDPVERMALRRRWGLPEDKFLVFFPSRVSHEKDPETVLRATLLARQRGLEAVVLNLGGGYREFLQLAQRMGLPGADSWVLGRPAAHPMTELAEVYRAADVVAQGSLEEGLGLAPLEALATGTPVVATAVGGMAQHLEGYARLTPRRDAEAMAEQFLWVAASPDTARVQALAGRAYVQMKWDRRLAFAGLQRVLLEVAEHAASGAPRRNRVGRAASPDTVWCAAAVTGGALTRGPASVDALAAKTPVGDAAPTEVIQCQQ
jgi:glycosyltransferase involved in cell wall biosynthesis